MKRILIIVLLILGFIGSGALFPAPPSAVAAPQVSSPARVSGIHVAAGLVSLDLHEAEIADVLREIARQAQLEVTVGDGIVGKVSLQLMDATVAEALTSLCRNQALVYEYSPEYDVYRVVRALAPAGTGPDPTAPAAGPHVAAADGSFGQPSSVAAQARDSRRDRPGISAASPGDKGLETRSGSRPLYKSGELLVRFRPGVTPDQRESLHRSLGSTVLGAIEAMLLQRVRLREGLAEAEALALYAAAAGVAHTERHALRYPELTPDDPDYSRQWGLLRIGAPEAWGITQGSQEVVVAVIDSGVDLGHPDLAPNIWTNTGEIPGNGIDDDGNGYIDDLHGWDFAEADADPADTYGHGTHVAGIIAARGNNGLGIAGIDWRIRIMPLKVQPDDSNYFLDFAVIEALRYAKDNGARIVNCSFGGNAKSDEEEAAFTALRDKEILAVCAAGNAGENTDLAGQANYPSGYPFDNILSVAASDRQDALAYFSNYGLTSVDVMAPGVDIYSTLRQGESTVALVRVGGASPLEMTANGMQYAGLTGDAGLTGTLHDCGWGYAGEFPAGVAGNLALIQRGKREGFPDFYFFEKVANAQAAGAAGVIIYNNRVDGYDDRFDANGGTLGSGGNWIPAVSVTHADGQRLKALLPANPPVTLINRPATSPYGYKSGTSMAAPHVTGIAGLLMAAVPSLGYADIRETLLATVDKIAAVEGRIASGGRANACAALKVRGFVPPGDLSGDCRIALDDAVTALRVLAGLPPPGSSPCPACATDLDGDGHLGLAEAIFIMQTVAGLR